MVRPTNSEAILNSSYFSLVVFDTFWQYSIYFVKLKPTNGTTLKPLLGVISTEWCKASINIGAVVKHTPYI